MKRYLLSECLRRRLDLHSWLADGDIPARPFLEASGDALRVGDVRLPRRPVGLGALVPEPERFDHFCIDELTASTLEHLAAGVLLREPCLLEGETSTSKTSAILYLAALLRQPVVRLNLNGQTDTGELIGRFVPREEPADSFANPDREWVESEGEALALRERTATASSLWRWQNGLVVQAMKAGWWVLLDEVNLAEPQILERLNPVLEVEPALVLTEHDNEPVAPIHPCFRMFATMNPAEYAGRSVLSPAYRDRWRGYRFVHRPGEREYLAMLRLLVHGEQPNVLVQGHQYQGDRARSRYASLSGVLPDAILVGLARFQASLECAAGRGGETPRLGVRRKERHVFTRRGLLSVLDYLASPLGTGNGQRGVRTALLRYYLGRVSGSEDQALVVQLLDAAGDRATQLGGTSVNVEMHRARLSALAAGLCLDGGIRVEVSNGGWCWEPGRRVIHVGGPDLERRGADYCAGVLAHEVGHYHISRYHLFSVAFPSRTALATVLNGIEDPRVNTWIRRRYPGTAAWFDQLSEIDARRPCTAALPALMRFTLECAREELLGWEPAWSVGPVPASVRAALETTFDARQRYSQLLPPTDLLPEMALPGLLRRFHVEVEPRLCGRLSGLVSSWEQAVLLSAGEALAEAEAHILPFAARLWKDDVERMGRYLEERTQQGWARQALSAGDARQLGELVREVFSNEATQSGAAPSGHLRDMAQKVLETWLQQVRSPDGGRLGAKPIIGPQDGSGIPARELQQADVYDKARAVVAGQIEHLVAELEEIIVPRRRLANRSGFASGRRLELRKAMAFAADPRRHDQLWMRPTIPQRRDTAFLLLVDLSGSMRGPKTEAALAGTLLLAESLDRLEVPFAVYGFQDVLIPLCDFGAGLGPEVRAALASMGDEVTGTRADGNNVPEYNDDGPCLREAAEELLRQPSRELVLITVSDGLPEGRRSTPDDLRCAVGELAGVKGLRLVGVGLGANTEHVRDHYPESVACVPPEQLAQEIGRLLRESLRRG